MQWVKSYNERVDKDDERMFRQLLQRVKGVGIDVPSSLRSKPSMEQFFAAVNVADKQETDTLIAQSRFADAFSKVTNVRLTKVSRALVESLSESQSKQALLIACKIASGVAHLYQRQTTFCAAFKELSLHGAAQVSKLVEEMKTFVVDQDKLKGQIATTEKCYKACDAKLRKDASELRKRLAQAGKDLDALRSSNRVLTTKLAALEEDLKAEISKDAQLQEKVDELEEKLRCSICMDRQKDTVFACGHTCCKTCAGEWKRCYYNSKSERRQKPVRYAFPLYLS